jgi:CheY-like chemotaxis protein
MQQPVILILEDNPQSRFVLCALLGKEGYQVVEVDNEWDAIAVCGRTEQRVDLLVSDLIFSGANGNEVADRLWKLRPGLPILFISGYGLGDLVNRGLLDSGHLPSPSTRVSFLRKPFSAQLFLDRIAKLLAKPAENVVAAL